MSVSRVLLTLAICTAMVLAGCQRGCSTDALAKLSETSGTIERDWADNVNAWEGAAIGAEFFVGDGVKSHAKSEATLDLDDGNKVLLVEKTQIRFMENPPNSKERRLNVEMGEATVQTGEVGVQLQTAMGVAVIEPKSQVLVRKTAKSVRYEVKVGLAKFQTKEGMQALGAGEGIEVGIGMAEIERFKLDEPKEEPPPPEPDAGPKEEPDDLSGDIVAQITGAHATAKAPDGDKWQAVAAGENTFRSGTLIKLPGKTKADVNRGKRRAVIGGGTFILGAESAFVQSSGGSVTFVAAPSEVTVAVPGGTIVSETGAKASVKVKKTGTDVKVDAGRVRLETEDGMEVLEGGEEGTIGRKGEAKVVAGRGPGYVDMMARAGDSFAIHDPRPPTAIGFSFGKKCGEHAGVVELLKRGVVRNRSRGEGIASVLVPSGSHTYRIKCMTEDGIGDDVIAKGAVAVMRDSGTRRLPRTAPSTRVDTDGRRYTVMYQNLLPRISVRWPDAPKGGGYTLSVRSSRGSSKSISTGKPRHSFGSGQLRDGTHTLTFEGGGKSSKPTTVDIKFDNAAPTASLKSPKNGSFGPGSGVTVSGVAMPGWKITVGGKEIPQDSQQRFSASAASPANQRALAVRFVHPHRGVHYYLRRSAGH